MLSLLEFMEQREAIRLGEVTKLNPVLRYFRFTNIDRNHDRGTAFALELAREGYFSGLVDYRSRQFIALEITTEAVWLEGTAIFDSRWGFRRRYNYWCERLTQNGATNFVAWQTLMDIFPDGKQVDWIPIARGCKKGLYLTLDPWADLWSGPKGSWESRVLANEFDLLETARELAETTGTNLAIVEHAACEYSKYVAHVLGYRQDLVPYP